MPFTRSAWKNKRDGILFRWDLTAQKSLEEVPFRDKPKLGLGPALEKFEKNPTTQNLQAANLAIVKWKEFVHSEMSSYKQPLKPLGYQGILEGSKPASQTPANDVMTAKARPAGKPIYQKKGNSGTKHTAAEVCRGAGEELLAALESVQLSLPQDFD